MLWCTSLNPTDDFSFDRIGDRIWIFIIEQQKNASFVGKRINSTGLPRKLIGVVGFDNKTISMVDETGGISGAK